MGEPEVKSEVGVGEKAVDAFLEQLTEAAKLNQSDLQILSSALRVTPHEVMGRVLAGLIRAELRYLSAVEGASIEASSTPDPILDVLNRIAEGQDKILAGQDRILAALEARKK